MEKRLLGWKRELLRAHGLIADLIVRSELCQRAERPGLYGVRKTLYNPIRPYLIRAQQSSLARGLVWYSTQDRYPILRQRDARQRSSHHHILHRIRCWPCSAASAI